MSNPNDPIILPASSFYLPDLTARLAVAIPGSDDDRPTRVAIAVSLAELYATSGAYIVGLRLAIASQLILIANGTIELE